MSLIRLAKPDLVPIITEAPSVDRAIKFFTGKFLLAKVSCIIKQIISGSIFCEQIDTEKNDSLADHL